MAMEAAVDHLGLRPLLQTLLQVLGAIVMVLVEVPMEAVAHMEVAHMEVAHMVQVVVPQHMVQEAVVPQHMVQEALRLMVVGAVIRVHGVQGELLDPPPRHGVVVAREHLEAKSFMVLPSNYHSYQPYSYQC
jgi:hypothetical protein